MRPHAFPIVLSLSAALVGIFASSVPVAANGPGDAANGRRLATDFCSECHVVSTDQRLGGPKAAPDLTERMRHPGLTELALRSYMQTSHPVMPNIRLTLEQTDDLVAYLLTLKGVAP
ncbi:c-type cytochrome [Azospirillum sp. RWY-5-1]|uniref:C-type cytochrome n=1 Tax=Azospirillum oleiclasticum TaxID=2735135 RepID=A0ABX2TG47_9PROT|nr:cytochrome c [Azospirillum oleiclasticum]NYZ14881.1 c-type cytochrome [Azospirillum oleiclasticum]NYZ22133.1 c-type cytochrome [Azospirillum oleiclasticum]